MENKDTTPKVIIPQTLEPGKIKPINDLSTSKQGDYSPRVFVGGTDFGKSKHDVDEATSSEFIKSGEYQYTRAEAQDNWDKAGNAVVRFAGRAATSAAELVGNVYGLGKFAIDLQTDPLKRVEYFSKNGTMEGYKEATWTTIFDNEITRGLDNIDSWIKSKVPQYESKDYKNAAWYDKWKYANFYANDLADAAGFAVGSMVGGFAATKLTSNLFKLAKAGSLSKIDDISNALKSGSINEVQAAKQIDNIALKIKSVDYVDELTQMMVAGTAESGQEARSTKDATFTKIIDGITKNPLTGVKYREATESEIKYAEMMAENALEASFLLNMAVVGPTSKLMMDSVFKGYKGLKNTVDDIDVKFKVDATYDPKTQAFKPEVQNKYLRTAKGVGKVLGNNMTEAFQEMYQTGLQAGVEDFYNAKYHGKSDYDQLLKSTNVGLDKAVSDEGLLSAMLGFLTPGVSNTLTRAATGQNPLGNLSKYNEDTKKNILYTALLNKNKASDTFKTLYESSSRHQHFQNQLDNAIENSDDFATKNQMHNILENLIYSRVQTGTLQELYKDLDYFKSLSNDEFKEVFGVDLNEENRKTTLDFVQNKITKVKDLSKTLENVKSVFKHVSPANQARIWHATNAAKDSKERSHILSKEVSDIVMDNYKYINEADYRTHLSLLSQDYKTLDPETKKNFRTLVANSEVSLVDQEQIFKKLDDIDRLNVRATNYGKIISELNNSSVAEALDKTDANTDSEQDSDLTGTQSYEEHLSKKTQLLSEIEESNDHEEILKLSKELDKNPLLEASDIETINAKYNSIKRVSARRKQLTKKIVATKNKRDNVLSEIFKVNYQINEKANDVNEIVSDFENGNTELSKDKLFKLIDKTQEDIFKLQDYVDSLEKQLMEFDDEINSLETLISSNDTIESTIADRSVKAKELDFLNNEISETKASISKLQKILNNLKKIFKSLFPNYAHLLEKGKQEVIEYNEELLDQAQAIKDLKATLKELEEERTNVQNQISTLDSEIEQYEKLLNSIPELKFDGVDTTTDEVETVQDPKAFEFQPAKKDIIYALNSTAGNNMIGETDKLTEDPDQLRWFKYTDSLQVSSSSDIKLVAVTKTSNIFGEDVKFFDDNDIVLVVHENGKPVKVDGKLVFTSMRLPITLEKAKEKFTNKQDLTDVQIQTLIDDLIDTRESIMKSEKPLYLKVTSKTKGVPVYSKVTDVNGKPIFRFPVKGRLTKNSKNIDDIQMFVATEENTVVGTQVYPTVPGMSYFIYDQQVIPARVAKLGEIDGGVDKAVSLISELMNIAKPEYKGKRLYKDVKDELNLLITFGNVFGKDTNNPRQIFVTKDGRLNYGGKYYDTIDEVSLKSFLADKYIRIDKNLIKTNPKVKSPLNGKTVSYKNYLLNNDGKADNQVLVGTQLVEVGTQQFKNVGLRFDFSAGPREFVKPESKVTTKALEEQSTSAKKADIERRRQEELNQQTDAGYSTIALDYLFTGGRDVMLSTDYLLQALVGGFTSAAKEINDIRNKYANKLGNIRDDINSDVYNQMMEEIRNVISKTYNDSKANEIFDKILKNATGFTNREGNQISIELDKLNEQNESKINAKYDAELATLENTKPVSDKKADIERRKQGLNGIEEIVFSNPNFRLEGFEIDGNYWNVVTSTDRAKVLVNINGVIVPFYLTTGQAGKGLVPGWYPFFGIGKDGWLNKTDKSDMETYYERYWGKETADIVKSISEELNGFYGTDPSAFKNDRDPNATSRPLTTLADKVEDYINSKLNYTPAINNADARKTLRSNVEQLGKEINAKYDAELKALEVNKGNKVKGDKSQEATKKLIKNLFGDEPETPNAVEKEEAEEEETPEVVKEAPKLSKSDPSEIKEREDLMRQLNDFNNDVLDWDRTFTDEEAASLQELDAEQEWFSKKFPNIPYERVKGLVQGKAVGRFLSSGKVLISDMAAKGTTYHEAFHVVSQMFLTDAELKSLYKEYRDRTGFEGTDREVEELLAEDFRNYMLGERTSFQPKQKTTFQKIVDFLRNLLGLPKKDLDSIFSTIKSNKFKKPVRRAVEDFNRVTLDGKSVEFTQDLMESMTVFFFKHMLSIDDSYSIESIFNLGDKGDYKTVYDKVLNSFKANYASLPEGLKAKLEDNYLYVIKDWNKVVNKHIKYLEKYGIDVSLDNELIAENEKTGKDNTQYVDNITFSTKDGMPKAVKLLIASLPQLKLVDGKRKPVLNYTFGLPKSVNFNKTIDFIHNTLAGSQTLEEMVKRLTDKVNDRPELKTLLTYLRTNISEVTPATLSTDQFNLQMKFFQQFAKTKNTYLTTMVDDEGNIYSFDSNSSKLGDRIKTTWMNSAKKLGNDSNGFYKLADGNIVLNKGRIQNIVNEYPLSNLNNTLSFLSKLGVEFSTDKFTEVEEGLLKEAALKIVKYVVDKDIKNIFQRDAIGETIKNLINIEANYTKEHVELQHINPEGKTVYGITLNTYLSLMVDNINNTGKLEHLNPDTNPYLKNSLWKELIAKGHKINLEVLEGLASTDKDSDGVITSDLDMSSNLLQSINAILNNKFPFLRAGDKKLEYAFSIDFEMNRELFIDRMLKYYKDDVLRSIALKEGKGANTQFYNEQASRSLIFEEITPLYPTITNAFKSEKQVDNFIEKNKEALVKSINDWLDKEVQNNFLAVLNDYGLITRSESKGKYDIEGIDKSTLSKLIGKESELTYDEVVRLGELFLTKSFVANVEQTKLFTGDLAFYDIPKGDFNKRTGGLTGPKKVSNTDESTNNWLNENAKRSDGKISDGKIGSVVYEDVRSTSQYYDEFAKVIGKEKADEAYKNMKEADAQGYITLDEYREFFLRAGEWTTKHEAAYKKALTGEKLSKDDFQFFMPIKPQYFGPQSNDTLYIPTYYKLSLMPLIPSMIKDRKLAQLAESMKKNKVGIAMFGSANKVGAKLNDGSLTPFYDANGNINNNTTIQEIEYKYLGIQLDIAPIEKTEVKFGTQFRKLILSNLFSGGKGKNITVFDGDKLVTKNTSEIKKEYDLIINELTKERRKALENKLGLKIQDGKYTITDYNIFKDIILDEAESRDAVDNLLSSIELAFNGDIKAVDITMHKNKIEQILYAMVNNKVISQKVFGDMKVMGSSAGFEVKARKFKDLGKNEKSKIEWISNVDTLNFYHATESSGTSKMQVLLPSWFKEIVGEDLKSYDKRLLELIGYRIPTQGLNSIDSIEVVGFLPKEAGNLIITPSEIVGKAGSDYDVDKLNIFIPRYIMHSGKPHYIPTSTQALKKLFETIAPKDLTFEQWRDNNKQSILENRIIELSKEILSSPEMFDQLITPNSVSTLTNLVSKIRDLKGTGKAKITGTRLLKWYNNAQTALQFWSGKAGVGVSAIHNTSHILSQQAGLYMSAENISVKLPCNITENGDIDLSQEFSKDSNTRISDIINEFVNAYVDIAKDPFIFDLNAGIQTSGTWFFLLRAGVPVETIAMFMRQPIIWDYVRQQSINESMLNKSLGRELNSKKFEDKIRGMYPGKVSENYQFDSSLKKLESQLSDKVDNVYQQAVLTEFLKYTQAGVMLSDLMRATNADTKGAGKNRLTARYQSEMLSDLKAQGVFGNLDSYLNETILTEFIKTVDDSSKYFNDIFVTENEVVRDTLNEIEKVFKAKNYTFDTLADLMLLAENEIINYIVQTTPLDDVKLSDQIDELFKGDNSIAKQLSSAKNNTVLRTNLLVQELFPLLANNRKNIDNIKLYSKRLNNYESNVLTEAYEQLYNIAPDLADNLTKLGILQSGLNNSPISFLSIIPANKYFEIASKTIDVRLSGEEIDLSDFIDLFYQNNYQNSKIVKKISNRVLFGKYAKGSLNNKGELVVPESMSENNPFVKVVTKDKLSKAEEAEKLANGDSIYTTRLFKLVAPGEYKEVPVKGNGMYLKDYRKTDNVVVNKVKENKVFSSNKGNSKFDWEDASGMTFTADSNENSSNKLQKTNKSGKLSVKDSFIVEDLFDTYEDRIRDKIQSRGEKFNAAKSLAVMKEYAVEHGLNELKEYLKNCYN